MTSIFFIILLLILCSSNDLGKTQGKIYKDKYTMNNTTNELRNLQTDELDNNSITLYFSRKCNYPEGFANEYRNEISYVMDLKNYKKFKANEAFNTTEECEIEIQFSEPVKNLQYFFSAQVDENMRFLTNINFFNFDTSLVTDMTSMFEGCISLIYVDLYELDTSNVSLMGYMFNGCTSLTGVDAFNLNTGSVLFMGNMFSNCSSLQNLDLSSFDTSMVSNMDQMFYGCSSLKELNISNFGGSDFCIIDEMFYGCDSLEYLDISNFDMINCDYYKNIFSSISNLKYINLFNFKNDKIMASIFSELAHDLFVCQSTSIISNPRAFNCCDYDSVTKQCNGTYFSTVESDGDEDYEPNEESIVSRASNKSSNKISTGIIIGIIAGILVLIAAIIIVSYYICKKSITITINVPEPTRILNPNETVETNTTNSGLSSNSIGQNFIDQYEYLPDKDRKAPKIKIIFSHYRKKFLVLISQDRSVEELIQFYNAIAQKLKLDTTDEKNICFLAEGNNFNYKSKEPLKSVLKQKSDNTAIAILVSNLDEE